MLPLLTICLTISSSKGGDVGDVVVVLASGTAARVVVALVVPVSTCDLEPRLGYEGEAADVDEEVEVVADMRAGVPSTCVTLDFRRTERPRV